MFQVDQFESVFRSALHDPFELQLPTAESLLVVTDLAQGEADALAGRVAAFLGTTSLCDAPAVRAVSGEAFSSTTELLELVDSSDTDLICTYRNLHSEAWRYPHSLGEFLDVLLQRTDVPVLVMPHPRADYAADHALQGADVVITSSESIASSTTPLPSCNQAVRSGSRTSRVGRRLTGISKRSPRFPPSTPKIRDGVCRSGS